MITIVLAVGHDCTCLLSTGKDEHSWAQGWQNPVPSLFRGIWHGVPSLTALCPLAQGPDEVPVSDHDCGVPDHNCTGYEHDCTMIYGHDCRCQRCDKIFKDNWGLKLHLKGCIRSEDKDAKEKRASLFVCQEGLCAQKEGGTTFTTKQAKKHTPSGSIHPMVTSTSALSVRKCTRAEETVMNIWGYVQKMLTASSQSSALSKGAHPHSKPPSTCTGIWRRSTAGAKKNKQDWSSSFALFHIWTINDNCDQFVVQSWLCWLQSWPRSWQSWSNTCMCKWIKSRKYENFQQFYFKKKNPSLAEVEMNRMFFQTGLLKLQICWKSHAWILHWVASGPCSEQPGKEKRSNIHFKMCKWWNKPKVRLFFLFFPALYFRNTQQDPPTPLVPHTPLLSRDWATRIDKFFWWEAESNFDKLFSPRKIF